MTSQNLESSSVISSRKTCIGLLLSFIAIMGIVTHVSTPNILYPMTEVPPNRFFKLTGTLLWVCEFIHGYRQLSILTAVAAALLIFFAWKGKLDRWIRVMVVLLGSVNLLAVFLLVYVETRPTWVKETYGIHVYNQLYPDGVHKIPTRK